METQLTDYIRRQFPALRNSVGGKPIAYLDGPGGYQVPDRVIRAMENYVVNMNANTEGAFLTSMKSDEMLARSREAFADFFNCLPEEVVFGANMTTLNFTLAQALVREMKEGDRVVITQIDHEANRGPWQELQERGIVIDDVAVDTDTCTIDMTDLEKKLSSDTKVVAFNYASNAVGTINDVSKIVAMAHEVGAVTVLDAVHYAAHGPIDVKQIGTDFLLCSAYKFFGPHVGVMYGKKEVLSRLRTMRLKPQHDCAPYNIETGTLNHEGIAGAAEAVEFAADIGQRFGGQFAQSLSDLDSRRRNIVSGLLAFENYEQQLTRYLLDELLKIPEITIYGPPEGFPRTSTVSFTYANYNARQVARYLASKGLFVWDGDFYATTLVERLGLVDRGGLVRIGIAPYNTKEELDRLIDALKDQASLNESMANLTTETGD